jgi:serine acetyltransferase
MTLGRPGRFPYAHGMPGRSNGHHSGRQSEPTLEDRLGIGKPLAHARSQQESRWRGARNRLLQTFAREVPGALTTRVRLHRLRGVNIGANVWIGYDVILDTSSPELITIEDNAALSVRVTVIAHMWEIGGVTIERDVYLGAGVIVLPSVVVGHGSVVTAGSVVSRSIPPLTLAQGNPAVPVAKLSTPFRRDMAQSEFYRSLLPVR